MDDICIFIGDDVPLRHFDQKMKLCYGQQHSRHKLEHLPVERRQETRGERDTAVNLLSRINKKLFVFFFLKA